MQSLALHRILSAKLNVADTDRLVEEMLLPQHPHPPGHSLPLIKDVRLFFNTMSNAVKIMKRSGIEAETSQRECGEYIEYVVRIPKNKRESA